MPVEIASASRKPHYAVRVEVPDSGGDEQSIDEIPAGRAARVLIRFPARFRGQYEVKQLCITSAFPFGLLRAARRIDCKQQYLVYPKPQGDPSLPTDRARCHIVDRKPSFAKATISPVCAPMCQENPNAISIGKPSHVASRLMTKQYTTEATRTLYLDFALVAGNDTEARLAQLALWIIEAERARRSYGLRLPGTDIAPSLGQVHFHRCLRALALFK